MLRIAVLSALCLLSPPVVSTASAQSSVGPETVSRTADRLIAKHGAAQAERIRLGVRQAAQRWWGEDGDADAFTTFCETHFVADPAELDQAFERIQKVMEQVDGHLSEVRRELITPLDLDTGPVSGIDQLFSNVDLSSHIDDDLYASKVAFFALLNFPIHTLQERIEKGPSWDRETWARSRMMDRFILRWPAALQQEITRAFTSGDQYIASYYIRLDRLITPDGKRLFPEGLRVITHWGLRDELAAHFNEGPEGLAKQRMILAVMQRIVRQEIPAAVIDNADLLWDPVNNKVRPVQEGAAFDAATAQKREPDTRYEHLLDLYHAARKADPASPGFSNAFDRRFNLNAQIPEKEVEALLVSVLISPEAKDLAKLIQKRLGRPLEPFDLWYSGFKSRGSYSEEELDRIVGQKYPNVQAFQAGLPDILKGLGFSPERSAWLAERIVIDPSRGAGHALQAVRREDKSHLRTRIPPGGMNYKGYNIAIHELGHNVEQVFSLHAIDHWWLSGVPNNAFTEALAFVFQHRDLELLGLQPAADARSTEALGTLWSTYEISGVSLVEMKVWHWMYEHPDATPAQLREATVAIAKDIWNRYYAPVFGVRDSEILAVYSHMIYYSLYLSNYSLGHIIAFQVADKVKGEAFGSEFERVARQGSLTPDAWIRGAVGEPLSARALLQEARRALDAQGRSAQTGR
jgi:hypothetical protein